MGVVQKVTFATVMVVWCGYTIWSINRRRRNRTLAGNILLDCGRNPQLRVGWLFVMFTLIFVASTSMIFSDPKPRDWFALPALLFWLYPLIPRCLAHRHLCQNGVLWQGNFMPWTAMTNWSKNADGELQLTFEHTLRSRKEHILIRTEWVSAAEKILLKKVHGDQKD